MPTPKFSSSACLLTVLVLSAVVRPVVAQTSSPPVPPAAAPATPAASKPTGHALIIGIEQYAAVTGAERLTGVPLDVENARTMAGDMGIPADQISFLRDAAATPEGIDAALTALSDQVQPGEPVLVYYSGHGTHYATADGNPPCAQALYSYPGQPVPSARLTELLRGIADKTDRLFVFIDACFSGGAIQTRGVDAPFRVKFVDKAVGSNCDVVANLIKQPSGTRSTTTYTAVLAARDNEMSLDSTRGGLATSSWMQCLSELGKSAPSIGELRACAQEKIDAKVGGSQSFLPHHIVLYGDDGYRPYNLRNASLAAADAGPGVTAASATAAGRNLLALLGSTFRTRGVGMSSGVDTGLLDAPSFARRLDEGRDKTWALSLQGKKELRIGADKLDLSVQSPRAGYVYLWAVDSSGASTLLFPNRLDAANRIEAGKPLRLPRASWPIVSGGPAGETRLLLVVSERPHALLKPDPDEGPDGPTFVAFPVAQIPGAVTQYLNLAMDAQGNACSDPQGAGCSARYAMAELRIHEKDR